MLLQAATEATKNTSSIFLDGPVIVLIATNVGLLARDWIRARKIKKNGNGIQPGKGEACQEHSKTLVKLETKQEGTDDDIREMKANILMIVGDVKILLGRTLPRI